MGNCSSCWNCRGCCKCTGCGKCRGCCKCRGRCKYRGRCKCSKCSSTNFTGYLHLTNNTSQKIVDLNVKTYNPRTVSFDEKSFAEKLIAKGEDSVREDFLVRFEKWRSKNKKHDYQYRLSLKFADGTQDIVEFQQLAVLPKSTIVDVYGYKVLRNDHNVCILRDRPGRGFKIGLSHSQYRFQDWTARDRILQAEKDMEQNAHESALQNYRIAHKKATEESTLQEATRGQAQAYSVIALRNVEKALLLEQDSAEEAQRLLVEAKRRFKEANYLCNTWQHSQHEQSSTLMVEGNALFNEACGLENKALNVLEEMKEAGLAGKYLCDARGRYLAAAGKFREGLKCDRKLFLERVEIVEEQVAGVERLINGVSSD